VLHNDFDENGDTFVAALVNGPAHAASFKFNADGTFVYTPELNYVGPDFFTYVATDPAGAKSEIAVATINVLPVGVDIAPTDPATTTSLTATFTYNGPPPVPTGLTFDWQTFDGVNWVSVANTATFSPAPTGAAGILLRSSASFADPTDPANILTTTSEPVRYVLGTAAAEQLAGFGVRTILFADDGDDVITAGTARMQAYGGAGNDRFVAVVGDGNALYDGQAGINTYDLSGTSAGAAVSDSDGAAVEADACNHTAPRRAIGADQRLLEL